MSIDVTVMNGLYFAQTIDVVSNILLPTYGNLTEANNYFARRLRSKYWQEATTDEKIAALTEATRIIDSLNFIGTKTSTEQLLEFPRGKDTQVPFSIRIASYEIALALLDEVDPNLEVENLSSQSQGFGGLRDTYSRDFVLDHIRAGVPSAQAWAYLKPYLIDPNTIRLSRVD